MSRTDTVPVRPVARIPDRAPTDAWGVSVSVWFSRRPHKPDPREREADATNSVRWPVYGPVSGVSASTGTNPGGGTGPSGGTNLAGCVRRRARALAAAPRSAEISAGGRPCHRPAGRRGRCRRERPAGATEDTHGRPFGGRSDRTDRDVSAVRTGATGGSGGSGARSSVPTWRAACFAPARPPHTGPCILRLIPGSRRPISGGRADLSFGGSSDCPAISGKRAYFRPVFRGCNK
jgi:hypothetical protein